MLRRLHIAEYALIDAVEVELGPGLNVLTGETGAGKSILVDSLSPLLGSRARETRSGRAQSGRWSRGCSRSMGRRRLCDARSTGTARIVAIWTASWRPHA